MNTAAEPVLFKASGSWPDFERRLGGPLRTRTLFCILYLVALWLDHALRQAMGEPALIRPSVGLLLIVLWLSRASAWPVILGIHCICAVLVGTVLHGAFSLRFMLLDVVPGAVTGLVGAVACLALIRGPLRIHVRLVPRVIWAFALGATAGAGVAWAIDYWLAPASLAIVDRLPYHWGGLVLGALTSGPTLLLWTHTRPEAHPELVLRSRRQLAAVAGGLAASVVLVFWWSSLSSNGSLLPLPVLVGPLLIYACFCLPPRWAIVQMAMTNLLCAALWVQREEPYVFADPLFRIGLMQVLLGIFAIIPFIFSMVVAQVRITLWNLGESEHRYRSFVQLSHEAVWRVEVDPPMPLGMPLEQQRDWMHRHARLAESNLAYDKVAPETSNGSGPVAWNDIPWRAELERRLAELTEGEHYIEGLRFAVTHAGRIRNYLISISAMLEGHCIRRLWGVARDVTELVDLNAQLQREQQRLRSYARLLVSAEEKARRATAIDLHDGIGQTVTGTMMIVEAARDQPQADMRLVLDEIRARLRDVHEFTRRVISDLSPPGLYDLGLEPALQWLSVQLRTQDRLQVTLECQIQEERITVESRVLIFRLVRELLRNVIKHAGVLAAQVLIEEEEGDVLRVTVSDNGRGFDSQRDMFGERASGFGLWSIADRLRDVGGTIHSESTVGQGARFVMRLPLRQNGDLKRQQQA